MSHKGSDIGRLMQELAEVRRRRDIAESAMLDPAVSEDMRHECALELAMVDQRSATLETQLQSLGVDVREDGRDRDPARDEDDSDSGTADVIDLVRWRRASRR